MLIYLNIVLAIPAGLLGLLAVTGDITLTQLKGVALISGILMAAEITIRFACVNELVKPKLRQAAITMNAMVNHGGRAVAALLVAMWISPIGEGWAFMINAASWVLVLASLVGMKPSELRHRTKRNASGDAAVPWRVVAGVLVLLFIMSAFGLNTAVTLNQFAEMLDIGAAGYGILTSLFAVGLGLGTLLHGVWNLRGPVGRERVLGTMMTTGALWVALAGISVVVPTLPATGTALVGIGMFSMMFLLSVPTYLNRITPDEHWGLVMGLYVSVTQGSLISGLVLGPLSDAIGPLAASRASVVIIFVAGLVGLRACLRWCGVPT
jgi:MFS family permease